MTYAPEDLKAVQRYAQAKTGQPWASLGITHQQPDGGGYHEGMDLLVAARRAPGPQYPYSDYSYTDAPARDLAAPHNMALSTAALAGGDAASAFDLGGAFPRFLEFNAWMRARMLAGDPRTRDIREMIHTLDRRTVRRIDRTGKQADGGDNSHLTHTHFSFFRDSLGRRDRDDNFLGLLREFFDGKQSTEVDELAGEGPKILDEVHKILTMGLSDDNALAWWIRRDIAEGKLPKIIAMLSADEVRDKTMQATVDGLTKAITALSTGGASIDTSAIIANQNAVRDEARQQFTQLAATNAALQAKVADLQARLARAAKAESDALTS